MVDMQDMDVDIAEKEYSLAKTSEEWEAIEKAERKTFKGKIKYAWQDYVYYPLYRIGVRIKDFPEEVKYFYQRGVRGYCDRDAWGIDGYLSSFLPEILRHMI